MNVNKKPGNEILGLKCVTLYGKGSIRDTLCGVSFDISPLSFYQVNHDGAEVLYRTAAEFAELSEGDTLLDLYCGVGTIGLSMAKKAGKLIGVEVIPATVENAKENARRNGIVNASFICADAGKAAKELAQNNTKPDVVIVDPPRKGCGEDVIEAMKTLSPKRIVMVSCNSATAARDCARLAEIGYLPIKMRAVDMFPRTGHVETVCLLSKLNTRQHIEVDIHMDELDLTDAEKKATYGEIKDYVLEHTGLKVSSLYIAQVKQKCGIIERENYNKPKSEDARQPQCPPDKEKAIKEALLHFGMI